MGKNLPRPPLDEERLMLMLARAGRVWRGESQPQVGMAEDVLLLVGELRETRALLRAAEAKQVDKVFDNFESTFRNFKSTDWTNVTRQPRTTFSDRVKAFFGRRK